MKSPISAFSTRVESSFFFYVGRCVTANTLSVWKIPMTEFLIGTAAKREILPGVEHRQHRYLNNRAENSHQPTRQRERRMQGFKSSGHAQRFLSAYGPIAEHFRPRRHRLSASAYRQEMQRRFATWQELTTLSTAAQTSKPEAIMFFLAW
jgi:transposase-like protein